MPCHVYFTKIKLKIKKQHGVLLKVQTFEAVRKEHNSGWATCDKFDKSF